MEQQFESDGPGGVYIIRSMNYFFLIRINVHKRSSGKMKYTISVSPTPHNKELPIPEVHNSTCMQLTIRISSSEQRAHIDSLNHEDTCSMCDSLGDGNGTGEMIKCILSFCSKMFGIKVFSINDADHFWCEDINQQIPTRVHDLLVFGKSWLESNVNAVPMDLEDKISWNDAQYRLSQLPTNDSKDEIVDIIRSSMSTNHSKIIIPIVLDEKALSWNEIFLNISKIEKGSGCVFFQTSIMEKLYDVDVLDIPRVSNWIVNVDNVTIQDNLLDYKRIF